MSSPSASMNYTYDGANRLTMKSESIAGRSYSTTYEYNGNDNITDITYPSGRPIEYGYNSDNQVTSVTGFGGSVTSVIYNTAGLPTSFALSNGINNTISYNSRNLTTGIIAGGAVNVGYTYDSRGNTKTMSNNIDSSKSQAYGYDALSRLTEFSGAWGSGSYRYDPVGNRTIKTVAGVTTTYGYANNRMSSASGGESATYNYNGIGALTDGTWEGKDYTLTYDGFDNLSSVDSGSTSLADFGYDGDGMRVYKTSEGKTTVYHYDQGGRVISEDDGNGTLLADYIYLNGKLIAKVFDDSNLPPAAPTGLTASAASSSGINLSWADNSSNESGFAIERKTGSGGTYAQIGTVGSNVKTFSDTGLAANTTYYYRVRAVNGSLYSSYTGETNATTLQAGAPAAPTGLTATAVSTSGINLSWTDNSSDETGFAIERHAVGGTYTQVGTVGANVKTYSDTGLTANTTYYYRVRAAKGSVFSAYSNERYAATSGSSGIDVTVSADRSTPQPVGSQITFSAAASGGSGNYEYYFTYRNPETGTWSVGQAYSSNASWTWNTTGLPVGTYTIQVWARNSGSTASYEAYRSISYTLATVQPASSVTVTTSKSTPQPVGSQITFSATATGGSGNYEYYFTYYNPETGTWSVGQAYSSNASWTWNTTGLPVGTYTIQVWVRSSGSTAPYEAYQSTSYTLENLIMAALAIVSYG